MTGYDHVISLEHEDGMMSFDEGVAKGLAALREVVTVEQPGEMFWA
jgi:sugar phosphate isomerase/epimerase